MKKIIFLSFLNLAVMAIHSQTVTVTYNGGAFSAAFSTASIDKLIVTSTAPNYLTLGACQQIRDYFKTGKGAGKLTLDLSSAAFANDSLPNAASETNGTFASMTSLTEVILPNNLRVIGGYTFKNCTNLTTVNYPATLKKVLDHAFALSSSSTKLILTGLGNTQLEVVGTYAFYNNSSTSNPPTLLNTIKNVGSNAFRNTAVNVTEFAEATTTIGSNAFDCGASASRQKITMLTFPSTLTSLAGSAFANQPNVAKITFKSTTPPFSGTTNPFPSVTSPASVTVYVPCESSANYQGLAALSGMSIVEMPCENGDDDPEPGELIVQHTTTGTLATEITAALGGASAISVTKLTIKGITNLSYDDCRAVVTIFSTDDLNTLKLTDANFENSKIPQHATIGAFENLKIDTLILPTYLEKIGQRAFKNCMKLANIQFSIALNTIELGAFTGCSNLNIMALPSTLKTIDGYVFQNCSKLALSELPNGLKGTIGAFAFANTKVTISYIPCAVTSIDNSAFAGVSTLTQISFPDGIASLGPKAFASTNLTSVTLRGDYPPSSNTSTDGNHSFGTLALSGITLHVPSGTTSNFNFAPWNEMNIVADAPVEVGCVNPRTVTITYAGKQRTYLLYLPDNYASTMKADGIIISCHGFGGEAGNALARFQSVANNSQVNMIAIAPIALPEQEQDLITKANAINNLAGANTVDISACWGQCLHVKSNMLVASLDNEFNTNIDDAAFIRYIVQKTVTRYNANPDNVFFGGISMGGYMAYEYARRYGNELAGIINYVGSMKYTADTVNVTSDIKTPILDFHSLTDDVVFYVGTGTLYGIASNSKTAMPKLTVLNWWRGRNGAAAPVITDLGSGGGITGAKKYYYDHADYEITHFQMDGAAHGVLPSGSTPFNHSTEVRDFILRHKSAEIPNGNKDIKPQKPIVFYPAIAKDVIFIEGIDEYQQATIYDIFGRQMEIITLRPDNIQKINVSRLQKGIYLLKTGNEVFKFYKD